ncbi:MAG: methyltransferase [Desulfobacteraceae bacterium]|nr:MAG: methyltransferase [Desulfobacteraceae bacterium]
MDRFYIEEFLRNHSNDIKNRVLEIADPNYTLKFGGDRVTRSDVLHLTEGNSRATLIGSLATGKGIPQDCFDCMILTQTYHTIYDVKSALLNTFSALKEGGVLLATLPGISQISRYDMDRWGDYWRFTDLSARLLFSEVFGPENVLIETHGNVLTAIAFLHGLSAKELKPAELSYHDPNYQLLITVRAVKPLKGNT